MDCGLAPAPAAPTALRRKNPDREGQMVGGIPVIEWRPVCLVEHLGAHHEIGFCHGPVLLFDAFQVRV
jgi:hypothetical protein